MMLILPVAFSEVYMSHIGYVLNFSSDASIILYKTFVWISRIYFLNLSCMSLFIFLRDLRSLE